MARHLETTFFSEYQARRGELLDVLTPDDLALRLGGDTDTLGSLCREIGETEHGYIESFRTFRHRLDWRHPDPGIATSIDGLRGWYAELDRDLFAALDALTGADLVRRIDRDDFDATEFLPLPAQELDVYREALLIFYGKASVYLRALGRPFPGEWQRWIG
jgi:hypothetical protein